MDWLKAIWKPIEKVLKFIGKVQSTILLTITYLVLLAPIAIGLQLTKLLQPKPRMTSYWKKRVVEMETEETLLRQF